MTRKRFSSPPMPGMGSTYVGIFDGGSLATGLTTLDGAPYSAVQFVDPDELRIEAFLGADGTTSLTYRRVSNAYGDNPSGSSISLLADDPAPAEPDGRLIDGGSP